MLLLLVLLLLGGVLSWGGGEDGGCQHARGNVVTEMVGKIEVRHEGSGKGSGSSCRPDVCGGMRGGMCRRLVHATELWVND